MTDDASLSANRNANLYAQFEARFPADRERPFLETDFESGRDGSGARIVSYGDLDAAVTAYAAALTRRGARPGDRVAVQVEKSPEAVFLYLACLKAGLIFLPLNPAYTDDEIAYFIADAEPAVIVCVPDRAPGITALTAAPTQLLTLDTRGGGSLPAATTDRAGAPATAVSRPDDIAAILYTSGTTGRPKGAMISHENLASNARALHAAWGFAPGDVLLHALPIFHVHGLFVALNTVLLNGTGMLFLDRFGPDDVIALLARATVFMGVPTYYTRLLGHDGFTRETCANMRLFVSGSAPLLAETFAAFEARTGHRILERYGMTETGMNTSNPLDGERIAGTVGFPLPGIEVRSVGDDGIPCAPGDIGVLQLTGPNVFKGYWRNPEKTAEEFTDDGWFITGDLASIDETGRVSIVGREKDLIISGGLNVYPKEVEQQIDTLEGVAESAVVGIPHPDFGEQVVAFVVRADGAEAMTERDVRDGLAASLARYKQPKVVRFIDALPRNAMGKVQKNVLREKVT